MEYEVHPACAVIPLPPEQEINELAESIKISGLLEPITLTRDNLLLDGRCRLKACTIAGVEVRTMVYEGDDPVMFVLDKNIHRRHLTNTQRELAVAKLANLRHGSNRYIQKRIRDSGSESLSLLSIEEIAKKHGVPKSAISRASTIINKAAPHVVDMVSTGQVKPYMAAEAVRHTPKEAQANWTVEDVKRAGRKVVNREPGRQTKSKGNGYHDPLAGLTLSKLDVPPGPKRRGDQRVFLWPPHIQDLMDAKIIITVTIGAVFRLHSECEHGEHFDAALQRLLAYQPVPGKSNGEQIDFAAEARKQLKLVAHGKIRKVIDWLGRLESAIADAVQN